MHDRVSRAKQICTAAYRNTSQIYATRILDDKDTPELVDQDSNARMCTEFDEALLVAHGKPTTNMIHCNRATEQQKSIYWHLRPISKKDFTRRMFVKIDQKRWLPI